MKNLICAVLLILACSASAIEVTYPGSGGGGSGGSATNVVLRGAQSNLVGTNGTGDWTILGNVSTSVSNWVPSVLSPIHLLEATKRDGQSYSPGNFSGAVVTNSQYLLIGAPGTEGVVRELVIVPFYTGFSTINSVVKDLRLLVYADSNLTVNVSLAELCGMRYHPTSEDYILNRQSYYANTYVETTNAYSLSPLYQMFLKFPMPYTNGCWARITNTVGGSNWVQGYMTAYVDRTPIPTAIRDYRMYCYSTNQALSGAASNYWTTVTGSGQIVGMAFGLTNSNPTGVAEFEDSGGFGFWLNNAVQWEPDGMDDFFHATIGGIAGREFIGEQVGITRFVYDGVNPSMQEGYRWMPNDSINFTNGFTFYTDGGVATEAYFNLWYYRKP